MLVRSWAIPIYAPHPVSATRGWPMRSTRRSPPGSPRPPGGRRRWRRRARWSSGRCWRPERLPAARVERGHGRADVPWHRRGSARRSGRIWTCDRAAAVAVAQLAGADASGRPASHVGAAGSPSWSPIRPSRRRATPSPWASPAAAARPAGGGDRGHRALPGGAQRQALADQLPAKTEGGPLNLSVRFMVGGSEYSAPGGVVFVKPKNPTSLRYRYNSGADQTAAARKRRGKSGHHRARVPGNARTGKPDGKRNREQTAVGRPRERPGKGETVV